MKHPMILAVAMLFGIAAGTVAYAGEPEFVMDTAPGPAFTTVDGKITKIEGPVYTIQSESTGYQNYGSTKLVSEMKIYVSGETKKLHGDKKVGDKVRAEITRGNFANSIQ